MIAPELGERQGRLRSCFVVSQTTRQPHDLVTHRFSLASHAAKATRLIVPSAFVGAPAFTCARIAASGIVLPHMRDSTLAASDTDSAVSFSPVFASTFGSGILALRFLRVMTVNPSPSDRADNSFSCTAEGYFERSLGK
jgi:hypothetical protein